MKVTPIDLAILAQATGVQFASAELVETSASCLDEIAKETEKDGSKDSSAAVSSSNEKTSQQKGDTGTPQGSSDAAETSARDQTSCNQSAKVNEDTQKMKSDTGKKNEPKQDAVASQKKANAEDSCDTAPAQSKDWVDRVVSAGHSILWPQTMSPSVGPTLLTGVRMGEEDRLVDDLLEWERKLENANLDNHKQFLQNAQLTVMNHPLEATA